MTEPRVRVETCDFPAFADAARSEPTVCAACIEGPSHA